MTIFAAQEVHGDWIQYVYGHSLTKALVVTQDVSASQSES